MAEKRVMQRGGITAKRYSLYSNLRSMTLGVNSLLWMGVFVLRSCGSEEKESTRSSVSLVSVLVLPFPEYPPREIVTTLSVVDVH